MICPGFDEPTHIPINPELVVVDVFCTFVVIPSTMLLVTVAKPEVDKIPNVWQNETTPIFALSKLLTRLLLIWILVVLLETFMPTNGAEVDVPPNDDESLKLLTRLLLICNKPVWFQALIPLTVTDEIVVAEVNIPDTILLLIIPLLKL